MSPAKVGCYILATLATVCNSNCKLAVGSNSYKKSVPMENAESIPAETIAKDAWALSMESNFVRDAGLKNLACVSGRSYE